MAQTGATCPHCTADLDPPDVAACFRCGYNLRSRPPGPVGGESVVAESERGHVYPSEQVPTESDPLDEE
jgi:hypothetical protein